MAIPPFIPASCEDINFELAVLPMSAKDRRKHKKAYDKLSKSEKSEYFIDKNDIQWISARGLYDSSILTYEEHIKEFENTKPDWTRINQLIRSFCITGGFTIEFALKNYLLNLVKNEAGADEVKGKADMREMDKWFKENCKHDMRKLFNKIHEKDKDLIDELVKFIDKHKKSITRISTLSVEQMICGKLLDFGNSLIRYGRQEQKHDMSVVLLFMVFLDNKGIIDIPPPKKEIPFSKHDRQYIKLEDISEKYKSKET